MKRWFWISAFCLFVQGVNAQSFSNLKTKNLLITADTLLLDSVSLVEGSFHLAGLDSSDYEIDTWNAVLIIKNASFIGKTICCSYRTFPYRLNQVFRHKDTNSIEKNLYAPVNPLMIKDEESNEMLSLSDASLNTSGSLSRGITVGNNQDMALNSNLNLQLSGKLSEEVEILANITDKNIPIQPEGNTRQIQEFDKIFIQLKYKDKISLLAGDIDDYSQGTYFMRFTKKGQGLMSTIILPAEIKSTDTLLCRIHVSGAIAKGTFRRQSIEAVEGNQGPYRLNGANNESYIIVLSGSERIYMDGKLLSRGEDADYVINYNSGELTFTTRQPITKDKRIVAEFEYSDQNYTRAFTHISTTLQKKKWDISFHFYDEEDFKNQSNQVDLTNQHIDFLKGIGNRINEAYYPYMDSVGFQRDEVMYKITDTLVNGLLYDSVFVYSTNEDNAVYRLGFTLVGEGKGNYRLTKSAVNGKVYAWVAPIGGIPQGNYEPVILLITPKRTQMYSVVMNYELPKNTFVHLETALSNNDLNTFSRIGNTQNVGMGLRFALKNTLNLQKQKNKGNDVLWEMHSSLNYETKNKFFDYIENYRDVEFMRNFNLADSLLDATEHYAGVSLQFERKDCGTIGWTSNLFVIPEHRWNAQRHRFLNDMKLKTYRMLIDASLLQTVSEKYQTVFLKHKELFSKEFKKIEIGISEEMEFNQYQNSRTDSLLPLSYAYNEAGIYVKNNESTQKTLAYHLSYSNRIDKSVFNSVLGISAIAHQLSGGFDFLKFIDHPLRFTVSYRNLTYKDSLATTQAPENTLLANVDYQGRFCKGAIQTGIFYELGSGMEQKNAYSYLKVTDGQGTYQWIDYNKNGIEELDEFEVAVYKDQANYIRIWMVSNEYIKTYNNRFTQSLSLRPAAVWANAGGFRKFIARFANITTYQTQLKQTSKTFSDVINPFYSNVNDTTLVSTLMQFRNAFSFNQNSSLWGLDVIYTGNKNKLLNVNGFESINKEQWQFSGRLRFFKDFTVTLNYYRSFYAKKSEYFTVRNFRIIGNSIEPILSYQFDNKLTVNLLYSYSEKINRLDIEKSYTHKVSTEINYRMLKRGSFYAQLNYYHIVYKGETNSSIAYEMLESLQPGHNGVFTIAYQTNLFQNLQLNLLYEGRVSPNTTMIHTGSVEIRAFF